MLLLVHMLLIVSLVPNGVSITHLFLFWKYFLLSVNLPVSGGGEIHVKWSISSLFLSPF